MSDINRHPVEKDEKGADIQNVYSSTFIQSPNNNTDITQRPIELYYTDLDVLDDAELFMGPGDAYIKRQNLLHKFPNHIVKFYMFYYTEQYGLDGKLSGVKKELCQVVPGTRITTGSIQEKRDYRSVKRKSLKSLYDKIDFIQIYRPLNGIKWYTVSKEELNTELAVIKEFYGLTNFPDKVGEYYYSKKIGKWLATNELASILKGYEEAGQEVPVIYPDEIVDGYIVAERKSVLEIIWDYVVGFLTGIGDFLGRLLGISDDTIQERFNNFVAKLKDENGNWIPDGIDGIIAKYNQEVVDKDIGDLKAVLSNYKFNLSDGIINGITAKFNSFIDSLNSNRSSWGFINTIWDKFVDWIKDILNLDFSKDD